MYKTGLNGGYYAGALQQAHSTTPHDAPHTVGGVPLSVVGGAATNVNPSPVPNIPPVHVLPQVGLQLGLVSSKSVGTIHQQNLQILIKKHIRKHIHAYKRNIY